jgi:plasmid stability protein
MTSMTIRDVPQETRDVLAARAKASGRSLQEYVRMELIALAKREEKQAWIERVEERKRNAPPGPIISVEQLLEARDSGRR